MVKQKHTKDRLFISSWEHEHEWGGKKREELKEMVRLPFHCCSLSLEPFKNPVCSPDGVVFDIVNIIPFIKKYQKNPVTGKPLKITDLIKLNVYKNSNNEYHDPISFKVFNEFQNIIAIKTSGNVFSLATIEELNRKKNYWQDLLTSEKFTNKDIITLQDPTDMQKRIISNFDYVQKDDLKFISKLKSKEEKEHKFINQDSTQQNILTQIKEKEVEDYEIMKKQHKSLTEKKLIEIKDDPNSTNFFVKNELNHPTIKSDLYTTNDTSTSSTCTGWSPGDAVTRYRNLKEDEIRQLYYKIVKEKQAKGYVTLETNLGNLNCKLHCDWVPKTCENFLELCEKKYYDQVKFHRLVKNFVIQGGDPTGTGNGGESIFDGSKFADEFHLKLSHKKSGILSMANSGTNTNGSQFFITLNACQHLDKKHSVFGEVVGGLTILDKINEIPTEQEKPKIDIVIFSTIVYTNPFREAIEQLKNKVALKGEEKEEPKDLKKNVVKNTLENFKFKKPNKDDKSLLNSILYD